MSSSVPRNSLSFAFQFLVQLPRCAADEAHGAEAVAPAIQRRVRRGDDFRMFGKAEVIVRAKIQHLAFGGWASCALGDTNVRVLRRGDDPLGKADARPGADFVPGLRLEMFSKLFNKHKRLCYVSHDLGATVQR